MDATRDAVQQPAVEIAATIWGPLPIGDTILCVCAWCNSYMGERDGRVSSRAGRITHGMCPACVAEAMESEYPNYRHQAASAGL